MRVCDGGEGRKGKRKGESELVERLGKEGDDKNEWTKKRRLKVKGKWKGRREWIGGGKGIVSVCGKGGKSEGRGRVRKGAWTNGEKG